MGEETVILLGENVPPDTTRLLGVEILPHVNSAVIALPVTSNVAKVANPFVVTTVVVNPDVPVTTPQLHISTVVLPAILRILEEIRPLAVTRLVEILPVRSPDATRLLNVVVLPSTKLP